MFELIWIVLIGAVVGALAKLLMPGDDPGGFLLTAVLGMVGAVVATMLGRMIGCTGRIKAPASSPRSSGPSSCCSCTAGCERVRHRDVG